MRIEDSVRNIPRNQIRWGVKFVVSIAATALYDDTSSFGNDGAWNTGDTINDINHDRYSGRKRNVKKEERT